MSISLHRRNVIVDSPKTDITTAVPQLMGFDRVEGLPRAGVVHVVPMQALSMYESFRAKNATNDVPFGCSDRELRSSVLAAGTATPHSEPLLSALAGCAHAHVMWCEASPVAVQLLNRCAEPVSKQLDHATASRGMVQVTQLLLAPAVQQGWLRPAAASIYVLMLLTLGLVGTTPKQLANGSSADSELGRLSHAVNAVVTVWLKYYVFKERTMNSLTIPAADIPAVNRLEAAAGYTAVMSGLAEQMDGLSSTHWAAATDCTGWTVRDIAAHLLGAQEDMTSIRRMLQRQWQGHKHYPQLSSLDASNQQQIDDHAEDTNDVVVARYLANTPRVARRVAKFPALLSGITLDKTMAPGGLPLRTGYLFSTIYLRDAWMHGIDLSRATGVPRPSMEAERMVVGQILRDVSVTWSDGPQIEVELTGEISGTWRLGPSDDTPCKVTTDGVDFCRRLSGRLPDTGITLVVGDSYVAQRLASLRVVF